MSGPGFSYLAGVHVAGTSIWCDAARARGVTFVSRADLALGRARPERIVTTGATARLREVLGLPCPEPLLARVGRPFALGRARLELLPSGALPGAAQLLVEVDGWRGLYAGAISPGARGDAEPLQVRACDELLLDAPEHGGVSDGEDALRAAAEDAVLAPADARAFFDLVAILGQGRVRATGRWAPLGAHGTRGAKLFRAGARGRRVVSGRRLPTDDVIALGREPGCDELVRFVLDCAARRAHVRVRPGPLAIAGAQRLVAALRGHGIDATPIGPPEQLSLFPG